MQVLVGDDVEVEALLLEPVDQVEVGVELPGRPVRVEAGAYFGRMFRIGRRRDE